MALIVQGWMEITPTQTRVEVEDTDGKAGNLHHLIVDKAIADITAQDINLAWTLANPGPPATLPTTPLTSLMGRTI